MEDERDNDQEHTTFDFQVCPLYVQYAKPSAYRIIEFCRIYQLTEKDEKALSLCRWWINMCASNMFA